MGEFVGEAKSVDGKLEVKFRALGKLSRARRNLPKMMRSTRNNFGHFQRNRSRE